MFGSELRTYCLGAVVSVLLGVGIGFGWHNFVDKASASVAASAVTPSAQQDALNPPSSDPPPPREGPSLEVPRPSDLPHTRQLARHNPRKMCSKGNSCRKY